MDTGDLTTQQVNDLKNAIDNNQQDSPTLAIDPENNKMTVVGDPNNTHPSKGEYRLKFEYYPDEVNDEDKRTLTYDKDRNVYIAEVTYKGCRVKPVYRTKVTMLLLDTLVDVGIVTARGYTSQIVTSAMGTAFIEHTEELLTVASLVLGEKRERLEHLADLPDFLIQLMNNEPNIIQEGLGFLHSQSQTQTTNDQTKATPQNNTTQN